MSWLVGGCSTASKHAALPGAGGGHDPFAISHQVPAAPDEFQTPKHILTIPDHPSIDAWTATYTEKSRNSFQTLLGRAEAYVIPVQDIFARQGLPEDLVYVALVESGFSPTARSSADAVGMWQFIASTGKRFGLQQNKWVDERRHPFKAAQAAADYLSHLHDLFGSWSLALAAYNCGENRVRSVLDESGLKTFWELRDNGLLPAETRDYVPKVMAAVRISRTPLEYGFHYEPHQYTPRFETVSVPGGVKLCWLSQKIGVEESTLRKHNPELCTTITPPEAPAYELCVPLGAKDAVVAALNDPLPPVESIASPPPKAGASKVVKTAAGSKGKPASRPGNANVQKARSVASSKNAKAVAKAPAKSPTASGNAAKTLQAKKSSAPSAGSKTPVRATQKPAKTVRYSVQRGDTVQSVAERFRISANELRTQNELGSKQKLTPGKVLTIATQEREPLRTEKKRAN